MVRKNERTVSRFHTLDVALDMVTYTTDILANPKVFDPKYQRIIDRMQDEATMIYHNCRVANLLRTDEPWQLKEMFATDRRGSKAT